MKSPKESPETGPSPEKQLSDLARVAELMRDKTEILSSRKAEEGKGVDGAVAATDDEAASIEIDDSIQFGSHELGGLVRRLRNQN